MRTYKEVKRKVEDKVMCDVCGKICTNDYGDNEHGTLEMIYGYGSKRDGSRLNLDLCEQCIENIIQYLNTKPIFNKKAFDVIFLSPSNNYL